MMIAKDSLKAEMTIENENKDHKTNLDVLATDKVIRGTQGIEIDLKVHHISKQFGEIKTNRVAFLEPGLISTFKSKHNEDIIEIKVQVSNRVKKAAKKSPKKTDEKTAQERKDPRICMAKIHEAQQDYKKIYKTYAGQLTKLKYTNSCPKNAKLTLTRTQPDQYIVIGSFENQIWVLTQDRHLIKAKK